MRIPIIGSTNISAKCERAKSTYENSWQRIRRSNLFFAFCDFARILPKSAEISTQTRSAGITTLHLSRRFTRFECPNLFETVPEQICPLAKVIKTFLFHEDCTKTASAWSDGFIFGSGQRFSVVPINRRNSYLAVLYLLQLPYLNAKEKLTRIRPEFWN